ncbi:MAG: hypothetical protein GY900_12525 [Actinomycetia bacterium]|nr:hypothetical protein [Actinomycetes bacterium]
MISNGRWAPWLHKQQDFTGTGVYEGDTFKGMQTTENLGFILHASTGMIRTDRAPQVFSHAVTVTLQVVPLGGYLPQWSQADVSRIYPFLQINLPFLNGPLQASSFRETIALSFAQNAMKNSWSFWSSAFFQGCIDSNDVEVPDIPGNYRAMKPVEMPFFATGLIPNSPIFLPRYSGSDNSYFGTLSFNEHGLHDSSYFGIASTSLGAKTIKRTSDVTLDGQQTRIFGHRFGLGYPEASFYSPYNPMREHADDDEPNWVVDQPIGDNLEQLQTPGQIRNPFKNKGISYWAPGVSFPKNWIQILSKHFENSTLGFCVNTTSGDVGARKMWPTFAFEFDKINLVNKPSGTMTPIMGTNVVEQISEVPGKPSYASELEGTMTWSFLCRQRSDYGVVAVEKIMQRSMDILIDHIFNGIKETKMFIADQTDRSRNIIASAGLHPDRIYPIMVPNLDLISTGFYPPDFDVIKNEILNYYNKTLGKVISKTAREQKLVLGTQEFIMDPVMETTGDYEAHVKSDVNGYPFYCQNYGPSLNPPPVQARKFVTPWNYQYFYGTTFPYEESNFVFPYEKMLIYTSLNGKEAIGGQVVTKPWQFNIFENTNKNLVDTSITNHMNFPESTGDDSFEIFRLRQNLAEVINTAPDPACIDFSLPVTKSENFTIDTEVSKASSVEYAFLTESGAPYPFPEGSSIYVDFSIY